MIADDLGYDDTPIMGTGCEIKTPQISKLAGEGVTLRNYYVNAICTPTRTSLMSGRYPANVGLQHGVIMDSLKVGLPLTEKLVPEHMRELGYKTHMVGKWYGSSRAEIIFRQMKTSSFLPFITGRHLGFFKHEYTPQARGFDSHYGYYTGNEEVQTKPTLTTFYLCIRSHPLSIALLCTVVLEPHQPRVGGKQLHRRRPAPR